MGQLPLGTITTPPPLPHRSSVQSVARSLSHPFLHAPVSLLPHGTRTARDYLGPPRATATTLHHKPNPKSHDSPRPARVLWHVASRHGSPVQHARSPHVHTPALLARPITTACHPPPPRAHGEERKQGNNRIMTNITSMDPGTNGGHNRFGDTVISTWARQLPMGTWHKRLAKACRSLTNSPP
jgi:hypothetical protein